MFINKKFHFIGTAYNVSWFLPLLFFAFLPFTPLYNASLFILILLGVGYLIRDFKGSVKNRSYQLYLSLFLCIFVPMLLSLPDAIKFDETLRKVLSFSLYIFIGLVIINIFKSQRVKDLFLYGIGIVVTLWTIDALYQYLSGTNLLGYPYEGGQLTGIFYPKYRIGIVMAILSPFYFEFIRKCQCKFVLSWIMLVPFIYVILLGGNRTSWFMLVLSIVLYSIYFIHAGFYKHINKKSLIYGTIILILATLSIYAINPSAFSESKSFFISRISSVEYNPEDAQSNAIEDRVKIWEAGLRIVADHWLNGIGVRGFRYIDSQKYIESKQPIITDTTRVSTHTHQITLEILVETGVIGILGYILFWIILLKSIFQKNISGELDYMPWFIPVIIAVFPLNMHKSFYEHFSSTIIWMLVSLAIANYPVGKAKNVWLTK